MDKRFRMTYLARIYQRYQKARKALKTKILNELCKVCRYNRKYAIRKLSAGRLDDATKRPPKKPRGRPRKRLTGRPLDVLKAVWERAYFPWSVRLKVILKLWMPSIRRRFRLTPVEERLLLSVSASTIDRALRPHRQKFKRRLYGLTKPGRLLRHQIPIRTEHYPVDGPGWMETDTVSHSGNCAEGDFVNTVNLSDIHCQWFEARAVLGKGETAVFTSLQDMRQALPFALLGLDSDNGGEFINHHLVRWCTEENIEFTRSRPYKKDDNAHIEQKNWTHIRKVIGYDRYETVEAVDAMNDLYQNELRLWINLFQPSVRLINTIRRGSRQKRIYDAPQTPLDRLMASGKGDRLKVAHLKAIRERTDPLQLSETIDAKLRRIWKLANHRFPTSKPVNLLELPDEQKRAVQRISKIFGVKSVRLRRKDKPTV
jgi:hypothetical protein